MLAYHSKNEYREHVSKQKQFEETMKNENNQNNGNSRQLHKELSEIKGLTDKEKREFVEKDKIAKKEELEKEFLLKINNPNTLEIEKRRLKREKFELERKARKEEQERMQLKYKQMNRKKKLKQKQMQQENQKQQQAIMIPPIMFNNTDNGEPMCKTLEAEHGKRQAIKMGC